MLPEELWEKRAQVDNLSFRLHILPSAYEHVISPMVPKGNAEHAAEHRGLTVFSFLLRIHYAAQWQRLKLSQEAWVQDTQHGGRIGGEYSADAWDLQARIEIAQQEGTGLVGALLDYTKLFDMFSPNIVEGLLQRWCAQPDRRTNH